MAADSHRWNYLVNRQGLPRLIGDAKNAKNLTIGVRHGFTRMDTDGDGDTGENLGHAIQGWNSDLFGLVRFGLLNRGMIP